MQIQIELPNEIVEALRSTDLSRAALEALALEGYRSRRLGEGQIRSILGFSTPMQTHAFLKQHDVYLNYSSEELEKDSATLEALLGPAEKIRKRST